MRPLLEQRTYRALLFLFSAVPVAAIALGLFIAGWTLALVLAITPLVVPVLLGFRGAVRLLALGEAALARELLGAEVRVPPARTARGFWRAGLAAVGDPAFWLQQAYLGVRMTIGFGLAVGEATLIAAGLGLIATPITYRLTEQDLG